MTISGALSVYTEVVTLLVRCLVRLISIRALIWILLGAQNIIVVLGAAADIGKQGLEFCWGTHSGYSSYLVLNGAEILLLACGSLRDDLAVLRVEQVWCRRGSRREPLPIKFRLV